jgi:hypothetical protein
MRSSADLWQVKILRWRVENSTEQFPRNWFNSIVLIFLFCSLHVSELIIFGKIVQLMVQLILHYAMKAYGEVDV